MNSFVPLMVDWTRYGWTQLGALVMSNVPALSAMLSEVESLSS